MTDWTPTELAEIASAGEIRVAGRRPDGTLRRLVIVWHVVLDDTVYLRSVRGDDGAWYRGVKASGDGAVECGGISKEVRYVADASRDDEVDAAYRDKYGSGSAVRSITSEVARATTLRVEPI